MRLKRQNTFLVFDMKCTCMLKMASKAIIIFVSIIKLTPMLFTERL